VLWMWITRSADCRLASRAQVAAAAAAAEGVSMARRLDAALEQVRCVLARVCVV
jgi:hypothetical protein